MSHSLSMPVDSRVAQDLVVGWHHASWEAVGISLGGAPLIMVYLVGSVNLYRVSG